MLELPRGWNASGHKGVFQRLQKQVKEKRQREGERDEVVSLSSRSLFLPTYGEMLKY